MKKNILFVVVISLLYSCKVTNDKEIDSIQGNWYYLIKEQIDSSEKKYFSSYNEVYIDDKTTFHYTELVGNLRPEDYKVSNDSFFSRAYNGNMIYKGKLENINDNNFDLVYKSQVINYRRVKEGVTFKDVILKIDSLDNYLKDYNKRLLKTKK